MSKASRASIAQVVAKLVSARTTRQEEIPDIMRSVETALARLSNDAAPAETAAPDQAEMAAPDETAAAEPRPGRRRRAAPEAPAPVPETPPTAPPAPRLVRRADVAPAAPPSEPELAAPPPTSVRGIVKWFDLRARRGALRLPGHSGDVPVEAALLDEMGITRLYKGQEIEATLAEGETPRVERLALPGGSWQVRSAGMVKGRQARPVLVELKRESLKRVAARAEAELVLGNGRDR